MKKVKYSILGIFILFAGNHTIYSMEDQFSFANFPQNVQREIMFIYLNKKIKDILKKSESLPIAAQKIREAAEANEYFNEVLNKPAFTLQLIKRLAKHFNRNDEEIAKVLGTKGANERLKLQDDFLDVVCGYSKNFSAAKADLYLNQGADINWTGKHGDTPLACTVADAKIAGIKYLISKGVDVNRITYTYEVYDSEGNLLEGESSSMVALEYAILFKEEEDPHKKKRLEVTNILLNAGADPDATERLRNIRIEVSFTDSEKAIVKAQDAKRKKIVKIDNK